MPRRRYWVYVLASHARTLYVGVTGDIDRRILEHRQGWSTFTTRYRVYRLVYFEVFQYVWEAIAREKRLKSWRREKKVALIERYNPEWNDLAERLDEMRDGWMG